MLVSAGSSLEVENTVMHECAYANQVFRSARFIS